MTTAPTRRSSTSTARRCRCAGDGVHLTPDGGDFVGDAPFTKLDVQCRLKAQAVANSRQQVVETQGSDLGRRGLHRDCAGVAPTVGATGPQATSPATTPTTEAPTTVTTQAPTTVTTQAPTTVTTPA